MSEQNKKNQVIEKAKAWFEKFKKKLTKENKPYLYTAIGCTAGLIVILVVSIAISANNAKVNPQLQNSTPPVNSSKPSGDIGDKDEPVVTTPEGMITPIVSVAVSNDYGFYYNKTLNSYYEHIGIDFVAAEGTEVLAVDDGKVESIYKDDLLSGTEIILNHGGGIRTVYRFVTEVEGLKVGMDVEKGDVIATVAQANGDEYKDGAHLHFEVLKNGKNVDPTLYLTLDEK